MPGPFDEKRPDLVVEPGEQIDAGNDVERKGKDDQGEESENIPEGKFSHCTPLWGDFRHLKQGI